MRFVTLVETIPLISGSNSCLELVSGVLLLLLGFGGVVFGFFPLFLLLTPLYPPLLFLKGEWGQLELCPLSIFRLSLG